MFDREHHERIRKILEGLNVDLMIEAGAFFAGGTALVMMLGEYRESVDIDFMCSISGPGWRALRSAFYKDRFRAIFPDKRVWEIDQLQSDQYGIRGAVGVDSARHVKFEIVAEARVDLTGYMHPVLGVPVLDPLSMFVQKLCANVDRSIDTAFTHRDILDILFMEQHWGPIPEDAFKIAETHYGDTVRLAYERSLDEISSRMRLEECCTAMEISDETREKFVDQLGDRYRDDLMDYLKRNDW